MAIPLHWSTMVSLQVRKDQTRELVTKASVVEKEVACSAAQRDS